MIEAVENQSPDVIIVDERSNVHPVHVYTRASLTCTARAWHVCTQVIIVDELSNKEQCNAARTITGRGVAVVATVHGDGLEHAPRACMHNMCMCTCVSSSCARHVHGMLSLIHI